MLLNKHDKKYKEFVKLRHQLDEVNRKLRTLPWVELDEPYQRGWIIYYDLRDDIKRREDYPEIRETVEKGYSEVYIRNPKYVKAVRAKASLIFTSKNGKHSYDLYPHRKKLSDREHDKLQSYSKKYFSLEDDRKPWGWSNSYRIHVPTYWLVVKVKPCMVTHERMFDANLQKEYDYLKWRVWYSKEFRSFHTYYSKSYPRTSQRTWIRNQISKFMKREIHDLYNEKVPLEYTYQMKEGRYIRLNAEPRDMIHKRGDYAIIVEDLSGLGQLASKIFVPLVRTNKRGSIETPSYVSYYDYELQEITEQEFMDFYGPLLEKKLKQQKLAEIVDSLRTRR